MNIYIVRHAESHNNTGGRLCTYTDGDLTTIGELQAEYCRQRLEHIKFDKIYSSHLIRAIEPLKQLGLWVGKKRLFNIRNWQNFMVGTMSVKRGKSLIS